MPRFFFHVSNGHGEIPDNEGLDLESQSAARVVALDSIRSMIAEDARQGVIDLTGHIRIHDDTNNELLSVQYAEAFKLQLPQERQP